MTQDIINSLFEFIGAGTFILNIRTILRDKSVKGVSWGFVVFFTIWNAWDLFYYPSLNQYISFIASFFMLAANLIWIGLAIKYRKNK